MIAEEDTHEMEVDEVVPETHPSSNETEGGFMMCEVEEQRAARVEVQGPKRRVVIRVASEETQDYVRKGPAYEDFSQEKNGRDWLLTERVE